MCRFGLGQEHYDACRPWPHRNEVGLGFPPDDVQLSKRCQLNTSLQITDPSVTTQPRGRVETALWSAHYVVTGRPVSRRASPALPGRDVRQVLSQLEQKDRPCEH